ncbi:hypothetical protein F3Y22_tig00110988pilonHSYRG00426 [Hibiscus syriacus]|uniref:Uncharacterized protein n=1 Tax=Hibiscus syriacus TaxID=106335 RepID=A0A6A2Z8Q2_HIBSY|nr:hypothetical protein F3Y22_tig00110988pilonHSYRG00426 [Hibiscus syriacus]
MTSAGDEEVDAVLSDVESDEPVPIAIKDPSQEDVSVEKFREILAELDREKEARQAEEKSKSELQVSFNRLKALAHEAIKKRDECGRQRDEALREKEEASKSNESLTAQLAEANKIKEEVTKQREDLAKQLEEASKGKDGLRSEIETSAHMLVSGIEKISGKVNNFKNFSAGGLPRSQKYAGLPSVAYGVIKRTNEIVEELVKQIETTTKSRNEAREQIEQRNYEIAIEVSQLEATISGLREEIVDADNMDQSVVSESFFLPQETDSEENIRACLAGMESIYELTGILSGKIKDLVEEKNREVKSLNVTVARLIKEREHIGSLLRSALSRRMVSENKSKTNELFQTAENGLREAGIDFKFSKHIGDGNKSEDLDSDQDEIYTLAGALENIVKTSQLEIIELQHSVEELREESSVLKEHVEAQAKELNQRMRHIEELEEKERLANESVEGLMTDIAAAEEEITRWKSAAEQEAAAGRAVEQEFLAQLSAIKLELEEAKQAMLESEKKLKFKEETAAAAMAARDAAEKSLRLADMSATRLRERVEELTRQLEEFESQEDSRSRNRSRYVCWPWQWLGLDFVGFHKPDIPQQSSNEMELSEPLL